jgi:hypothetical protein
LALPAQPITPVKASVRTGEINAKPFSSFSFPAIAAPLLIVLQTQMA